MERFRGQGCEIRIAEECLGNRQCFLKYLRWMDCTPESGLSKLDLDSLHNYRFALGETSKEALTGVRPTIESDRTIATVTFPLKSAIQRLNVSDVPVNVPVKLTDTQQKVLQLIRNNPSITHFEMSQKLSINEKTASYELQVTGYKMSQKLSINEKTAKRATQTLRDIGLITREGSDKNGIWKLL